VGGGLQAAAGTSHLASRALVGGMVSAAGLRSDGKRALALADGTVGSIAAPVCKQEEPKGSSELGEIARAGGSHGRTILRRWLAAEPARGG